MATEAEIALLRGNTGDPSTLDDTALGGYLDAADGSEPRARVAALMVLQAGSAEAVKFSEGSGEYAEEAQQRFDHYTTLLAQARAEVAILDEQAAALTRGTARTPIRIAVEYVF